VGKTAVRPVRVRCRAVLDIAATCRRRGAGYAARTEDCAYSARQDSAKNTSCRYQRGLQRGWDQKSMTIRINAALRHRAPARAARLLAACACALLLAAPTHAAQCGDAFGSFMAAMAQEAQAAGVSRTTIDSAFAGVAPDRAVLAFDRRQRGTFRKSFEEY